MAEVTVFHSEVSSVVKIAIMAALDFIGKISKDDSTKEPDSSSEVSD